MEEMPLVLLFGPISTVHTAPLSYTPFFQGTIRTVADTLLNPFVLVL